METIDTLVIGGGQAGLAMSAQLSERGVAHLVLEQHRIAEAWRTARWDSLVSNGPAWHDRFPAMEFADVAPDAFASKDSIVAYFEAFAAQAKVPIRCGVTVQSVKREGRGFAVETSEGPVHASRLVVATGAFHRPSIPSLVPDTPGLTQMHSNAYRNPGQLAPGAIMVVGAGSSGAQIAEELRAAGRDVYLSVGSHDRPPRSYRGKDFVWWLGALGKWTLKRPPEGAAHVTIAVSGANGGRTIDFRRFARDGMTLIGRATNYDNGTLRFEDDLATHIAQGDQNYLSLLDEADAYVTQNGLDLPPEPEARIIGPDPECVTTPLRALNLAEAGVTTLIWATGFSQDFNWLQVDTFDTRGLPRHNKGVSEVPGLYFLGLPWLSMRGSSFIWGVWVDAAYLATQIAADKTGAV